MTHSERYLVGRLLSWRSAIAMINIVIIAGMLSAQTPILHLRADSLVATDVNKRVTSWRSVIGDAVFYPDTTLVSPLNILDGLNSKPTIRFANDGYLAGPDIFPTANDYTLYVVMQWSGGSAANNLLSGNTRALFLAASPYPRVIHNGNFSQMSVSALPVEGPTVVRVEYEESSGRLKLAVNNRIGDESAIPQNTDPAIFIGSYARGNFLWGNISEIILYDRLLDSADRANVEREVHQRYAIERAPDPLPPVIIWNSVPKRLQLYAVESGKPYAEYSFDGNIPVPHPSFVRITDDSSGINIGQTGIPSLQPIHIEGRRLVYSGLHQYRFRVDALMPDSVHSLLDADSIVGGVAIAIQGQSNSIFADATQTSTPFARTFGSNFGQAPGDTVFKRSVSTASSGGANVGAWGLRLQNLLASELNMPSCVINGGVGGTTIQQHFPDLNNRMNLGSIYGSWLYRLEHSGLRDNIRWLFWYQGESNSGSEDYAALFATMYSAWKADLPNLQHIVVVQIRPGCGGTEHARLRDDQRLLQDIYKDVIVHSASGLPGHDGCHYNPDGYRELGDQLFRLYRDIEAGVTDPGVRSPTIQSVQMGLVDGTIQIKVAYAYSLQIVQDNDKPLSSAFFFNGIETLRPDSAWISGTTIFLLPPKNTSITAVSYIPSKNDPITNQLYEGPWLTDEVGSGMLTFHNVPVIPSDVYTDETYVNPNMTSAVVRRGESIISIARSLRIIMYDLQGNQTSSASNTTTFTIPTTSSPGVYYLVFDQGANITVHVVLVTD